VTDKAAPNTGKQSGAGSESLPATEAQDIAQFETWLARLATEKGPVVTAAHRDYERYIVNAWNQNPLFGEALDLAHAVGDMKPLADYIASIPLTESDRRVLAGFIRSLQKPRRGRPPNLTKPASVDTRIAEHENARAALHSAAYLVRLRQQAWRREHDDRRRVPRNVTEDLISEAIAVAEKSFDTRPDHNRLRRLVEKNPRTIIPDK
jgi:hypothetical protein